MRRRLFLPGEAKDAAACPIAAAACPLAAAACRLPRPRPALVDPWGARAGANIAEAPKPAGSTDAGALTTGKDVAARDGRLWGGALAG